MLLQQILLLGLHELLLLLALLLLLLQPRLLLLLSLNTVRDDCPIGKILLVVRLLRNVVHVAAKLRARLRLLEQLLLLCGKPPCRLLLLLLRQLLPV